MSHAILVREVKRIDDFLLLSFVDALQYWTLCRKFCSNPPTGALPSDVLHFVTTHITCDSPKPFEDTRRHFTTIPHVRTFVMKLQPMARPVFLAHAERYMHIWLAQCPVEINTTDRYSEKHESCVVARRLIPADTEVLQLRALVFALGPEDEVEPNALLVIEIDRGGRLLPSLLVGPLRFVNHDCEPNSRFVTARGNQLRLRTIRPIVPGEEVTVSYGSTFFGSNRCRCASCERQGCGAFAGTASRDDNDSEGGSGLEDMELDTLLAEIPVFRIPQLQQLFRDRKRTRDLMRLHRMCALLPPRPTGELGDGNLLALLTPVSTTPEPLEPTQSLARPRRKRASPSHGPSSNIVDILTNYLQQSGRLGLMVADTYSYLAVFEPVLEVLGMRMQRRVLHSAYNMLLYHGLLTNVYDCRNCGVRFGWQPLPCGCRVAPLFCPRCVRHWCLYRRAWPETEAKTAVLFEFIRDTSRVVQRSSIAEVLQKPKPPPEVWVGKIDRSCSRVSPGAPEGHRCGRHAMMHVLGEPEVVDWEVTPLWGVITAYDKVLALYKG